MKTFQPYFDRIKKYVLAHKVISTAALIVVLVLGWNVYAKATSTAGETRYMLGTVSTSTIIATVSASGQISSSDSVDIKPKVTGDITRVYVKEGQKVSAGQALMQIDAGTAAQALQDAKNSLAAAELQYSQDSAAAPINFQKDQIALSNAEEDLNTEYTNVFNALATAYLDEPGAVTGLHDILYGYDFSPSNSQWNVDALPNLFSNNDSNQKAKLFAQSAKDDYAKGRALYDPAVLAYKAITRASSNDTIEKTLGQSIDSTTQLAQSAQSELNFLSEVNDLAQANSQKLPTAFTTLQTNARSYLTTINSDLSSLVAEKKALAAAKQTVITDQQNLTLDQVGNKSGTNPISLQISANNIETQKQDIANQEANLADYTIRAPFAGTVSAVDAKVGDQAGSAAVATVLSNQSIAELSLNEVDAAKVAVGQKATLTFDAISDLTLTGTVAEVDTAGTVSQGVVSYGVKISLDSQDPRIKSGMTVNASIQTAVHPNVLAVPSSAVKTLNGSSYVLVFTPPLDEAGASAQGVISARAPAQVPVTVGISDDTNVEIVSGLTAGEQVVTRTNTGAKPATTASPRTTTTGARGGNAGFGGGAAVRL